MPGRFGASFPTRLVTSARTSAASALPSIRSAIDESPENPLDRTGCADQDSSLRWIRSTAPARPVPGSIEIRTP